MYGNVNVNVNVNVNKSKIYIHLPMNFILFFFKVGIDLKKHFPINSVSRFTQASEI